MRRPKPGRLGALIKRAELAVQTGALLEFNANEAALVLWLLKRRRGELRVARGESKIAELVAKATDSDLSEDGYRAYFGGRDDGDLFFEIKHLDNYPLKPSGVDLELVVALWNGARAALR